MTDRHTDGQGHVATAKTRFSNSVSWRGKSLDRADTGWPTLSALWGHFAGSRPTFRGRTVKQISEEEQ